MVRVLFISAPFKERFFLKMIRYFSNDVESFVVVPSYPKTRSAGTPSFGLFPGLLVGDRHTLDAVKRFQPHIVYSDSALYGAQFKISQYASKQGIPTIVHLRGDIWREFLGWMRRSSIKSLLLGSPTYLSGLVGARLADKITPICRWLEREVKRRLPGKRTQVVYQGVDPSEFSPNSGMNLERPAVAIIQNHTIYEKTRGLLMFADAVKKLPKVHFYITTGEAVSQRYFRIVRTTFEPFRNVHFISDVHYPDGVRRLLAGSDLYVLASNLDCCPTTVLEASLMEKPVLASRVGGVPEIIREGYTGWTIENGRTDDWVDRISMLIEDSRLARRLGRQGRQWVSENFAWSKIALQVEQVLMSESRRRGP